MRYPRIRDIENKKDAQGNVLCRQCGTIVPPRRRNYCSDECMNTFVRSNYWFYVRKDVLKRDKYRCSICNQRLRKCELDVDHIIPVQMGGQLLDKNNLRTLCRQCHRAKSSLDREALSDRP
jgi:5-methylcytosine-specific restriction endonuclease McrA